MGAFHDSIRRLAADYAGDLSEILPDSAIDALTREFTYTDEVDGKHKVNAVRVALEYVRAGKYQNPDRSPHRVAQWRERENYLNRLLANASGAYITEVDVAGGVVQNAVLGVEYVSLGEVDIAALAAETWAATGIAIPTAAGAWMVIELVDGGVVQARCSEILALPAQAVGGASDMDAHRYTAGVVHDDAAGFIAVYLGRTAQGALLFASDSAFASPFKIRFYELLAGDVRVESASAQLRSELSTHEGNAAAHHAIPDVNAAIQAHKDDADAHHTPPDISDRPTDAGLAAAIQTHAQDADAHHPPTTALNASDVSLDTAQFDGNLSSSDTDVQKLAQSINDLAISAGSGGNGNTGGSGLSSATVDAKITAHADDTDAHHAPGISVDTSGLTSSDDGSYPVWNDATDAWEVGAFGDDGGIEFSYDKDSATWTAKGFRSVTALPSGSDLNNIPVGAMLFVQGEGAYALQSQAGKSASAVVTAWTPDQYGAQHPLYGFRVDGNANERFGAKPAALPADITQLWTDSSDNRIEMYVTQNVFDKTAGVVIQVGSHQWTLHYQSTIDAVEWWVSAAHSSVPWTASPVTFTIHALGDATPFDVSSKTWALVDSIPIQPAEWARAGQPKPVILPDPISELPALPWSVGDRFILSASDTIQPYYIITPAPTDTQGVVEAALGDLGFVLRAYSSSHGDALLQNKLILVRPAGYAKPTSITIDGVQSTLVDIGSGHPNLSSVTGWNGRTDDFAQHSTHNVWLRLQAGAENYNTLPNAVTYAANDYTAISATALQITPGAPSDWALAENPDIELPYGKLPNLTIRLYNNAVPQTNWLGLTYSGRNPTRNPTRTFVGAELMAASNRSGYIARGFNGVLVLSGRVSFTTRNPSTLSFGEDGDDTARFDHVSSAYGIRAEPAYSANSDEGIEAARWRLYSGAAGSRTLEGTLSFYLVRAAGFGAESYYMVYHVAPGRGSSTHNFAVALDLYPTYIP